MEENKRHSGEEENRGRERKAKVRYGEPNTNAWSYCFQIGFFGGLIWGVVRWLCYELNLTAALPGFLVEPFFLSSFLKSGWGLAVGVASFIVFSIIAAYIYYFLLGRLRGPWIGVLYGIGWWAVWFAAIGPAVRMMKPLYVIGWDTITTEFCVFLLWGLFIGYTIAYEFTDEASREPYTRPSKQH